MLTVYGLLFLIIGPLIALLAVMIWSVLLVRFGLFTLWLEELDVTIDEKRHITKKVTRVLLGFMLLVVPIIIPIIYYIMVGKIPDVISMFLYSPIGLALAVEGWLVLLCYFGLSLFFNWLKISVNQYERVNRNIVLTILFIGILTGFASFNWWIYTANTDWSKVEELYRWGIIVLSPITTLLTIGLAVMLLFSLVQALSIETKKYERFAKILALTFVLLNMAGGILSIYPFL